MDERRVKKALQQAFLEGTTPKNLTGFYRGRLLQFFPHTFIEFLGGFIANIWLPWYGKTFYSKEQRGDNVLPAYITSFIRFRYKDMAVLRKEHTTIHVFPFTTAIKKSAIDATTVLQLDYNLPQNPPQVRRIVDELVCIGKNVYLGKAYIKEAKDIRLLAFFRLEK